MIELIHVVLINFVIWFLLCVETIGLNFEFILTAFYDSLRPVFFSFVVSSVVSSIEQLCASINHKLFPFHFKVVLFCALDCIPLNQFKLMALSKFA